ncbi:MAG: DUF2946 family protein [Burkholderiales bacterium]
MRRHALPAWLAMLAIALQALWPLLSQARPAQAGLPVALCGVGAESHAVEIPGPPLPVERRTATFHEHCKLCVSGAERLVALPPAPTLPLRAARAALSVPEPERAPSFSSDPHSPAAARAPPPVS